MIKELVKAVTEKDFVTTKQIFESIIQERIAIKIDDAKIAVTNKTFNTSEITEGMRIVSKHGDGAHTAHVYRDSDWDEYRVRFYKDGKHLGSEKDYHSDDLSDAKGTADAEIKRMNAGA